MSTHSANPRHGSRRWNRRIIGLVAGAGLAAATVGRAEAQTQAAADASPAQAFDCRAAQILGVPEADAATVVSIVCAELGRVSQGQGSYSVSIRPLGKAFVLSATRLPQGDTRTLTLEGLEETPLGATRLAEALVRGRRIEETERVDNLLAREAKQPHEKKGSVKWALGVVGLGVSGQNVGTGSGFSIGLAHEAPSWAAVSELQSARASEGTDWASLFSLSAGARRYLSRRNVAPFVGAGMEYLDVSVWRGSTWDAHDSADGTSVAAYLEAGVQVMRLSRARLTTSVRLHLPTSSLERQTYELAKCDERGCDSRPEVRYTSEYVAPATFSMSVSF